MKRTYILQDGGTITASCPEEFVTKLRQGSRFDSHHTDQEYIYRFADRYHDQTGHTVRADTPENFLDDLINCGYAKVLNK